MAESKRPSKTRLQVAIRECESQLQVAERFDASKSAVHRWCRHYSLKPQWNRGTRNSSAVLTEDDVRLIWQLKGHVTLQACADKFDVSISAIHAIWQRRAWTHVTDFMPDAGVEVPVTANLYSNLAM